MPFTEGSSEGATAAPFPGSSRLPVTGSSWIFKPSKLVCKFKSLIPLQRIDCHRGWGNWENKLFHLLMSPGCGDGVFRGFEMLFVAVTSVGKGKREKGKFSPAAFPQSPRAAGHRRLCSGIVLKYSAKGGLGPVPTVGWALLSPPGKGNVKISLLCFKRGEEGALRCL